jgi:hypothetical protein
MSIEFNTSLSDADWEQRLGGWRCDALLIPSTKIVAIYYDGVKADTKSYSVERAIIRWSETSRPKEVVVGLTLTKDLPRLEDEKLELEKDKLRLEKQKVNAENKWKLVAALGTTLSFLLTYGATHLLSLNKQSNSSQTQISIRAKVPEDIIKLLQIIPPNGLEIIFRSSRPAYDGRLNLIVTSQDGKEFFLLKDYDTIKRLEELGFVEFSKSSTEFDAALNRLKPKLSSEDKQYKVFTETSQLTSSQNQTLRTQSYGLTDKGRLVLNGSISVIRDQISQDTNK